MKIGHLAAGALDGVEAHLHGAVADGVDQRRHIVPVGLHHKIVEVLLVFIDRQALRRGVVGIGPAHQRGARAEAAVGEDLDGVEFEGAVAVGAVAAAGEELVDGLLLGQQALLGDAELELAGLARLAEQLHHVIGAAGGDVLEVVALHARQAVFEQVVLALAQHVAQHVVLREGQAGLDVVKDVLLDDAVGLAVAEGLGERAVPLDALAVDVQQLHGLAVEHADVEAGAHDDDRIFRRHGVEVAAVGKRFSSVKKS